MKPITKLEQYLGAPLCLGQSKKIAFEQLIYQVQTKIKGWKSKLLS